MVKKLNLSALQASTEVHSDTSVPQEIESFPTQSNQEIAPVGEKKKGIISLKKSNTTENQESNISLSESNSNTDGITEQTTKKAKVSLRGFKKVEPVATLITENSENNTSYEENNDGIQNTNQVVTSEEIAIKSDVIEIIPEEQEVKKEDIIGKIDSLNGDASQEEEKKEEVLAIIDGDTNCAIIKDDASEIFSSYKGSFVEVVEEKKAEVVEKKEVVIAKSQTIDLVETKKEDDIDIQTHEKNILQNANIESAETPNTIPEATSNENTTAKEVETPQNAKLSALQKFAKYKHNKKVWYSGVVSVFLLSIALITFFQGNNTKINVIESIPTPVETLATPIAEEITQPDETQLPVGENNNNSDNNEIVKENNNNSIDNTQNNNRIDPKVQNFLIKKYKSK